MSLLLLVVGGQTSMFGGGAFSGGGQSVSQSGFGTATFQNKPGLYLTVIYTGGIMIPAVNHINLPWI